MKAYKASSKSLFEFSKSASIWLNCGQCLLSTPLILILTNSREPDFPESFFTRNPTTSILGNGKMSEFRKTDLEIGFSAKICPLKTGRPFSEPGETYMTKKAPNLAQKPLGEHDGSKWANICRYDFVYSPSHRRLGALAISCRGHFENFKGDGGSTTGRAAATTPWRCAVPPKRRAERLARGTHAKESG